MVESLGLTSTSSPVVYMSSFTKLMAADSPQTWISSAHNPAQTNNTNVFQAFVHDA